jgi:hypothetical protein
LLLIVCFEIKKKIKVRRRRKEKEKLHYMKKKKGLIGRGLNLERKKDDGLGSAGVPVQES